MRSTEFLTDWNNKIDKLKIKNIKDFAEQVKRDCQPFLKQVGPDVEKYPMYRGIEEDYDVYSKIDMLKRAFDINTSQLDKRKPTGSTQSMHDKVNAHFIETRDKKWRNAVFATGDYNEADGYGHGDTYRIYPVGEFEFLWSPTVKDFHVHWLKTRQKNDDAELKQMLIAANYQTTNLKAAIDSGNEIHIWVNTYYRLHNSIPLAQRKRFSSIVSG